MARIGTVIRDVYRRPGAEAVPAHLERRYGIEVAGTTRLDAGVIRVDRRDGPPWVARVFIAARPAWRELGRVAGRLHALALPPGPLRRPAGSLHHLLDYEGGPEQDLAAAAAMLADLEGRVPDKHMATYEALLDLLPRGDDCRGLPESFVHPDLAAVNAIVTPDGPVLVDWTGAGARSCRTPADPQRSPRPCAQA